MIRIIQNFTYFLLFFCYKIEMNKKIEFMYSIIIF